MHFTEFNQLDEESATALLKQCVAIPTWGRYLCSQRPYHSAAQLYQTAQLQAQSWDWDEIAAALALHPRIGERQAAKHLSSKEQQYSAQEQAQLTQDTQMAEALYAGNLRYETQFGYIFLIRAKGRSSAEILAELERRLGNSQTVEHLEVKQQLAEIAILRLQQEVFG